jgi:hypothetical protein
MKTDDQIRKEAERRYPLLNIDYTMSDGTIQLTHSKNNMALLFRGEYFDVVKLAQSSMEAEIDRRANEKVEDWKKKIVMALNIEMRQEENGYVKQAIRFAIKLLNPSEGENQ